MEQLRIIILKTSRQREKLNLSTCADSSSNTKNYKDYYNLLLLVQLNRRFTTPYLNIILCMHMNHDLNASEQREKQRLM